jgi:hypothetical protein
VQFAIAKLSALEADVLQLALVQARKSAVSFPAAKILPEFGGKNTKG